MNLMIDLETLGTKYDCPVISIGACFFDADGIAKEFYVTLNVEEQIDGGRKVSGSTIKWWMEQSNAAQRVFKEEAVDTKTGLTHFAHFINLSDYENVKPWGYGSTFDISIMEHIFDMYNIEIPWKYKNVRDLRTYLEHTYDGADIEREGTYHNALDDAKHQARVVIEGFKRMEKNL